MSHAYPHCQRFLLFVLLLMGLPDSAVAQQEFEPGYIIDTTGVRTDVRIFNQDWRQNPEKIQVIRGRNTEAVPISTAELDEFGIDGKARYVNREVAMERSSTNTALLSDTAAVFRQERILLRVEVEGPATLYSYLAPQVQKYFLSLGEESPQQLVYTRTLTPEGQIAELRTFVQQLSTRLRCGEGAGVSSRLRYALAAIRKVVLQYNSCRSEGSSVVYENAPSNSKSFRITLLPGVYSTDFRFSRTDKERVIAEMPYRFVSRLGVDVEFVLPFAANKLAVLLRPSYYRFADSAPDLLSTTAYTVNVSYKALDIPFAVRYYSFLTPNLKLFATAGLGYTIISDGVLEWGKREAFDLDNMISLAGEVGVRYHDHWNLSVGYETDSSSLPSAILATKSRGLRLMFGYTL